jgi:glycosyltransferase involved in cell wall biosynthesis
VQEDKMAIKIHKILYLISKLRRCGPVNQLYYIIKYLDKKAFEPIILTLFPESDKSMADEFLSLGVKIQCSASTSLKLLLNKNNKLNKYIDDLNPDIIHSTGILPDIFGSKNLCRAHVASIRNYPYSDYPAKFGKLKGTLISIKHINTIKKISYPVSCSSYIAELFKEKHNINTYVLENGVDTSLFYSANGDNKRNIRIELGLPPEKTIFISTGFFIKRKAHHEIIEAFHKADIKDKACLLILGSGPLYNKFKDKSSNSIILPGFVKNVNDYLRAADIFVSASKAEGMPNSVLEAMASGLPVLLSDIGPHQEIIEKNPKGGFLFQRGNIGSMSSYFNILLNSNLTLMGAKSAETVKKYYSAELMSSKYQELYKKIINEQVF